MNSTEQQKLGDLFRKANKLNFEVEGLINEVHQGKSDMPEKHS